ncbi:flagellar filament capping protein FliD [Billgrantia sulfidoxydans]|uniref:Flagellar hook-associated protein 2 n=1 Tax=Billgrantia sulfidoxydans TaxID=2733484 RepID=A0ABX7W6R2_9GAMM|nr:flagellar filament capping protein FliD [Halomonas sulfidoxydans]QTP55382.1 flagellar filament capping protein FliD [Halomonas sulfidoxydans]
MASISSLGIGSGLDLNGLLNQLHDAERSKLEPIKQQIETQQVKISAYGELKGALSGFQSANEALNDAALFQGLSTSVNGDAVQAAAGPEASPGQYAIEVEQLATAGSLATQRVESLDAELNDADAMLELAFADNSLDHGVAIAADSTLEDVRDAINADAEAAVTASIVNDGEGYRLALMSQETGEQAAIVDANFATVAAQVTLEDEAVLQEGRDARFEVNGIAVASADNQVDDAIQGVALSLQGTGSSILTVEPDTDSIRQAVADFVESYNELKDTAGKLTAFNGQDGEAGELIGDSAVRGIESRLRSDLASVIEGSDHAMLADLGIALRVDGTLELDETKLEAALAQDPGEVGAFFAGESATDGMAGRLDATLEQLLDSNGALEGAIGGAENRIDSLNERYTRTEQSIDTTIARYQTQFGQLDGMLAQMNQTSAYLTQQLSHLPGQGEGGAGML